MRRAGKEMKRGCADRAVTARHSYWSTNIDDTNRPNSPHSDSRYNISLLRRVFGYRAFRRGKLNNGFVSRPIGSGYLQFQAINCDVWMILQAFFLFSHVFWTPPSEQEDITKLQLEVRQQPQWCTLQSAHFRVHSSECTAQSAHFRVHTSECTLQSAHFRVHSSECTLQSAQLRVHTSECTLQSAHFRVHSSECTLQSAQFRVHTSYTSESNGLRKCYQNIDHDL